MIFDSPPAGLFPDSIALARKTDEVLFVSRYGKVSRHVVKRLIGDLKATGANILGVILNDLPSKKATGYYYSVLWIWLLQVQILFKVLFSYRFLSLI